MTRRLPGSGSRWCWRANRPRASPANAALPTGSHERARREFRGSDRPSRREIGRYGRRPVDEKRERTQKRTNPTNGTSGIRPDFQVRLQNRCCRIEFWAVHCRAIIIVVVDGSAAHGRRNAIGRNVNAATAAADSGSLGF